MPDMPGGGKNRGWTRFINGFRFYLSILHQILVIAAIIAGGIWFIQRKVASPKITIDHVLQHRLIHDNVRWVSADIVIENNGVVPVSMKHALFRAQKIIPLGEEIAERIDNGFDLMLEEEKTVAWPVINEYETHEKIQVLPGEKRVVTWEIGIDSNIETVRIYTFFSENAEEALGIPASEVIGMSRSELHGDEYLSDEWNGLRDAISARKPFKDFQFLRRGVEKYISVSGAPYYDDDGNFLGYRGTGTDVTERRISRDALTDSEKKFRDFAEVASDWLWEMDADLRFTFISSKFEQLTGMASDDVIGKTREETAGIQYATEAWQPVKDAVAARQPFRNFQYRRVWPDGTERDFAISGIPLFEKDGTFAGYRGTGSDITEQKKTEVALAHSEQRFRGFAETMSDWLWEIDTEERFTFISENAEEILGVPRAQVIGKSRYDIHGDHYLSEIWKPIRDAIEARKPFRDFQYHRKRVDR